MHCKKLLILFCCTLVSCYNLIAQSIREVDICIYGGTSAGVIAAYTAKKANKTVLLVEPGKHLGGLSSGGLGYTDIGNKYAVTGLALDFYRRLGMHYGKFEQWIFEPHVAEKIFQQYIEEANVDVLYQYHLIKTAKHAGQIKEITLQHSDELKADSKQVIRAKIFIDCSYEGDLMAMAGVSYTVGREANDIYKETYNGVQLREKHQFPDGIDPYKIPGKPESGLLWGISAAPLANQGDGDKKVQAYNFRICLSDRPDNLIPIAKPYGYDSSRYELLLRLLEKKPVGNLWGFLKFDLMPNHKTDINNNGPFSTDMIGENYDYPEADFKTRKKIYQAHEAYVKGLLYFIGHDPRMPAHLRQEMLKWGYPRDEYMDNNNWSPQLYVREARRMVGEYVMTQANCEGKSVVSDGIGMAAYTMDSHNCQRLVVNGMVKNEGDVQIGGFGPYPISFRSILPKRNECSNLLVPVCLSASHIAYGSIRMEPVFMVLGQSAAAVAVQAIDSRVAVHDVNVQQIQATLKSNPLADGSNAEIVIDNSDEAATEINGDWHVEKSRGYGPTFLTSTGGGEKENSVKFIPVIVKNGYYNVYSYFLPGYANASSQTLITIFDGKNEKNISIKLSDIKVQGQTSGEWVKLGRFKFQKNKKAFVKITTKNADGTVIADAVLLKPDFK